METITFILILAVAVIASMPISRIVGFVPLPIVQIAVGAVLAWPVTRGVHFELEPEVFLLVFIPPLLYADAWHAPKREFWQMRGWIALMAFGLVFFTIFCFGYALHWFMPQIPLAVAFAAAAVLSPTDAVAVSSIVDRDKLPPRLVHLLEGESLLNDASGLVMFRFATAAALTGAFSAGDAARSFLLAVAGGVAAGLLTLFIADKALKILSKITNAAESQVLVMVLLPFMAYLLAERWHASGVIAAVIAGMLFARMGLFRHLGTGGRMLAAATWQMIGFALNGAIFVFLGLQLPAIIRSVPVELTSYHWLIQPMAVVIALTACLMGLRAAFLFAGSMIGPIVEFFGPTAVRLLGVSGGRFSKRIILTAAVSGVRGAVTLAGALSLPLVLNDGSPFPARDLVIFLATGVILCWFLLAWLILPLLTRNIVHDGHELAALELKSARIGAARAAMLRMEELSTLAEADGPDATARQTVAAAAIAAYRSRISALEAGQELPVAEQTEQRLQVEFRQAALDAEANALRRMLLSGEINDHTLQALMPELVLSQATLETRARR